MRLTLGLILCVLLEVVAGKGFFTIVGSSFLKLKSSYTLSVASQGYKTPQTLEIGIVSSDAEKLVYENYQNITLKNGNPQQVIFNLKNQKKGDYSLKVKSLIGDAFEKKVRLNMNTKKYSVFVQTDKAIYKPSDKVLFRVLILDADMKPYKTSKVEIYIADSDRNRIKQFDNIQFKSGVFQNELQLSDMPILGHWNIHVKVSEDSEVTKSFEVAEYVLPTFEVHISSNDHFTLQDGKIKATVKAKYTFGKLAKGNATLTAKVRVDGTLDGGYRGRSWWGPERFVEVSKSTDINGINEVEFNMVEDLKIKDVSYDKTVELIAKYTEELTGREQTGSKSVTIHKTRFKMELINSNYPSYKKIKPNVPLNVIAKVNLHDGTPVTDSKHPVEFTLKVYNFTTKKCPDGVYFDNDDEHFNLEDFDVEANITEIGFYPCDVESSYEITEKSYLTNGIAVLNIELPTNATKVKVTAKYQENSVYIYETEKAESASNQFIKGQIISEILQMNQDVDVDVHATESLDQLYYYVIGQGQVIVFKSISPRKKNFKLTFKPTIQMVPKSKLIIFYMTLNGEIISDQLDLEFSSRLKNHVDIKLSSKQAKPGDSLDIVIKSIPNSNVYLLGVDQSVLLLKTGNDIESSKVSAELEQYNDIDRYNYHYDENDEYDPGYTDFNSANVVLITNANKEYQRPHRPPNKHHVLYALAGMAPERGFAVEAVRIRKDFPETWLFDNLELGGSINGTKIISKTVPDTITSWIITGFSMDPISGLGLTDQPTKLNVFQPFFITTNLPYSIKRGEVVAIPILVFNYLDKDLETEITLFNNDHEFEFTDINQDKNEVSRNNRASETLRRKNVLVKTDTGTSVSFMIKPLKVGHITIKVVATSPIAGDGFERLLIVEPEGVTQYMNKAAFVDLRSNRNFKTNIKISIPQNAVPESQRIEASAVGDLLGPALNNLDKLIKLPYGCGEQNMLNFVPNIVVIEYLTILKKLTPEIEEKAKTFMISGYQRELTYKHEDGSYSVFGKKDTSGSTWLTAFVAKSFRQASKYISIEEKIIEEALEFLSKTQTQNGSFPEVGRIFDKNMQGGASKGVGLTAYVLTAFLENQDKISLYQNVIDKALNYITSNFNELDDNYSLAISTYALQLAKHDLRNSFLTKLESKAKNVNDMKYWEKKVPESDKNNPFHYQPNSVNVEMTAYALMAFVLAGNDINAVPIMKWMVSQRNENGGFQSTQDTVVGLQALSKLAMNIYDANSAIDISLKYNNGLQTQLRVNPINALILQKHLLPSNVADIELSATGRGFSILQISYQYNLDTTGTWPRFMVKPNVNSNSNKDFLHLTICTSFVPDDSTDKSNMAVMEVSFPSGFTSDTDHHSELEKSTNVKRVETKDGDTIVMVYFDNIGSNQICPEFKAYRTTNVANQKPAPVIVYDYYDNSRRATEFYNSPEVSLCDICEGDECKNVCEVDVVHVQ